MNSKLYLTCIYNSIDEHFARNQTVVVLVHLAEEIRQARFLVVHKLEESLAPIVPAEMSHTLNVLQVHQMLVQTTLSFPRQHPDVTPLIPQLVGTW